MINSVRICLLPQWLSVFPTTNVVSIFHSFHLDKHVKSRTKNSFLPFGPVSAEICLGYSWIRVLMWPMIACLLVWFPFVRLESIKIHKRFIFRIYCVIKLGIKFLTLCERFIFNLAKLSVFLNTRGKFTMIPKLW